MENLVSIVFIDAAIEDKESLIAGVAAGTEVVILNSNLDGVKQITYFLASHTGISHIHIVSHGAPGSLQLGSASLNLTNLDSYTRELQQWGSALTNEGNILLYGCAVAAGERGADFVNQLSQLTGAVIAASISPTGNAEKGGNWELEYTTGNLNTYLAFEPAILAAYSFIFSKANKIGLTH